MTRMINWTPLGVKHLRELYDHAMANNIEIFTMKIEHEQTEFVAGYAKYLLEYLEPQMGGVTTGKPKVPAGTLT